MKEISFPVKVGVLSIVGALVIALGANIGVWYGETKQSVVAEPPVNETDEITEGLPETVIPGPVIDEDYVLPPAPSLTPEEIEDLPYGERPLEASWYEVYANMLEDPTGFKRGVDYTPVIPYIHEAMKKGYLTNTDWKILKHEIDLAEAIPEKKRIDKAMKEARDKMQEALK